MSKNTIRGFENHETAAKQPSMIRGFNNAVANNIIIGFKERRRRKNGI